MNREAIEYGLRRFNTRETSDPKLYAINFRNSLIFLVPEDRPEQMAPLAWTISATVDGWEETTRSMNTGNARARAEAAGLERIEAGHPKHPSLSEHAEAKVMALTNAHLHGSQIGFSHHNSHPRQPEENSFYLLKRSELEATSEDLRELARFQSQIAASLASSSQQRRARLALAPKQPRSVLRKTVAYLRNPDVVAERLFLANGICDACQKTAPFIRAKENTPYLEVHHIVPLSENGLDTVENTQALCPNCHRRAHYG